MKPVWLSLALWTLVGIAPAHSHSPVQGIDGFYTGLLHPFSTPAQAALMASLGLLVSRYAITNKAWHWLPLAFLAFILSGLVFGSPPDLLDPALFIATFVTGVATAIAPQRLLALAFPFVACGGLLIGMASITDAGPQGDRLITMSGSVVGASLGLWYIFACIRLTKDRFTWGWVDIGFRVTAAWLCAIALIMLALWYTAISGPV